jgi:hypothetical protein
MTSCYVVSTLVIHGRSSVHQILGVKDHLMHVLEKSDTFEVPLADGVSVKFSTTLQTITCVHFFAWFNILLCGEVALQISTPHVSLLERLS